MFIRTRRLMLRPVFPEDWQETYAGLADWDVARMLSRVPWPYKPLHAREWCANPALMDELQFAITLPGTKGAPLIGSIGCSRRKGGLPYELGYWIARSHRGKGYASEAVGGVLEIARTLGLPGIEAGHFIDNPASGRVLRKCGFLETGRIQSTACAARGGVILPTRRYAIDLTEQVLGRAA